MFDFYYRACDVFVTMKKDNILIVDDDIEFAKKLAEALDGLFSVHKCHSEDEFRRKFTVGKFDLIIMDMRLEKEKEGLLLLKQVLELDPLQAAIVMTAYADLETYADALETGALTYLDKSEFSPALIAKTVEAILEQNDLQKRMDLLEQRLEILEPLEIIGASAQIVAVREQLREVAEDGHTHVIITGGPGTGKKLVAKNIHRISRHRSNSPFFCVSCHQIPQGSGLTKLFGTLITTSDKLPAESKGYVDQTKGGILVIDGPEHLDNMGRAGLEALMASGYFTRAGGERKLAADLQIILLSSASVDAPGFAGFHEKLVGELGCIDIRVPALNERSEDIPLIAQYTLQNLYRHGRTQARSVLGSALQHIESMAWPGNVRELMVTIEYGAILADASNNREIGIEHLPMSLSDVTLYPRQSPTPMDYQLHLIRSELSLVETVIDRFGITKKREIAEKLRYPNRFTFSRRIQRNLKLYPMIRREFPKTSSLYESD